jgi:hypothetical protein
MTLETTRSAVVSASPIRLLREMPEHRLMVRWDDTSLFRHADVVYQGEPPPNSVS